MDYRRIHDTLIERARERSLEGYTESHHVVPRCLGGTDDKENLVRLTPEEHYLVHQLLIRIHPGIDELVYAAQMMIPNRPSNKLYGWLRRRYSNAASIRQRGKNNTQHGTLWITDGKNNRKHAVGQPMPAGWSKGRTFPPNLTKRLVCRCEKANKEKQVKKKAKPSFNCPVTGEVVYASDVEDYKKREWSMYPSGRIRTIKTLANVFDISLGNEKASRLLSEAKEKLREDYHDNQLSTLELHEKYNMKCSVSHVSNLLKSLGIERRGMSESLRIYKTKQFSPE